MKYKDYVYQNFYNALSRFELESIELKDRITDTEFKLKLFDVCEKMALIGINAPKMRVEGTTHVRGCFQYKDIDIAVKSVIGLILEYKIENVDELLSVIEAIHMFAVNEENSNKVHATVYTDNSSIRFGEYHTFSELPDDIWNNIKMYIKECVQDKKVPNSARSKLFANN